MPSPFHIKNLLGWLLCCALVCFFAFWEYQRSSYRDLTFSKRIIEWFLPSGKTLLPKKNGQLDIITLRYQDVTPPPCRWISLIDNSQQATLPPSPLDCAVFLNVLKKQGIKRITWLSLLAWDQPDALCLQALEKTSLGCEALLSGVPCKRKVLTDKNTTPLNLHTSSEIGQCLHALEEVNACVFPLPWNTPSPLEMGFSSLDKLPNPKGKIRLLCSWNGKKIFPSLSLMVLMEMWGVSFDELFILDERWLAIGKKGPLLPLDTEGCVPLPEASCSIPLPPLESPQDFFLPNTGVTAPLSRAFIVDGKSPASLCSLQELSTLYTLASHGLFPVGTTPSYLPALYLFYFLIINAFLVGLLLRMLLSKTSLHRGFLLCAFGEIFLLWLCISFLQIWYPLLPVLVSLAFSCYIPLSLPAFSKPSP